MRLVAVARKQPLTRVLSSPFVRCLQTVQPLADSLGITVEQRPELSEGHGDETVDLIDALAGEDAALCTHGDVIPHVLQTLARRGASIRAPWQWPKGSSWVLHADGGVVTSAGYLPPPA